MLSEEDRGYIKRARLICDEGHKFEKNCSLVINACIAGWLCYFLILKWFDINVDMTIMFFLLFFVAQIDKILYRRDFWSNQSGSQHELKLIEFLEAKLAEAEVGTEKDNDLNADQSAEQAGQPSS